MALSKTTHGHGTQLWIKIGAGVLTRVAEIDGLEEVPGSSETELYETSSFDTVGLKEFKKLPLRDGVPIQVMGNYVINSAADALLQSADDEEGAVEFRVVLYEGADVYHAEGEALFYSYKRMNPADAKRKFEITMKPVAVVTIVEAP
jgi:hypothetical protein